jgi:hypothetical protein
LVAFAFGKSIHGPAGRSGGSCETFKKLKGCNVK